MQAQRYGYTQMINNAILTNSSYKLRFAQDLTLYLGELALDVEGIDIEAGKQHWLNDPIWQGARHCIEAIMGATDYLEQYFAVNASSSRWWRSCSAAASSCRWRRRRTTS